MTTHKKTIEVPTNNRQEDVGMFVDTPCDALNNKYATLLDGLGITIPNEQRILESLWPVLR